MNKKSHLTLNKIKTKKRNLTTNNTWTQFKNQQ